MYNDSLSGPVAHSVGQSLTQWASRSLSGPVAHSVKTCPLWISISSDSACKLSAKFLIYYYFIISVMIAQRDRSLSVLPVARVQFLATAEYFKGFFPGWSHSANPSWASVAENGSISPQWHHTICGQWGGRPKSNHGQTMADRNISDCLQTTTDLLEWTRKKETDQVSSYRNGKQFHMNERYLHICAPMKSVYGAVFRLWVRKQNSSAYPLSHYLTDWCSSNTYYRVACMYTCALWYFRSFCLVLRWLIISSRKLTAPVGLKPLPQEAHTGPNTGAAPCSWRHPSNCGTTTETRSEGPGSGLAFMDYSSQLVNNKYQVGQWLNHWIRIATLFKSPLQRIIFL